MKRGVYRLDCGGMIELSAVTADGVLAMRLSVREELYCQQHSTSVHDALDRFDRGARNIEGGVLRVVRDDEAAEVSLTPPYRGGTRWYSMYRLLDQTCAELHLRRHEIAAALGVDRLTLARFVAGRIVTPAWLPLALDAYLRPRAQELAPKRVARLLKLLTDLSEEFERHRGDDLEYAAQWAIDRPTMPDGLLPIVPAEQPPLCLHRPG